MAKMYWWHGSDLAEFFRQGAGMEGSDFRVEFHPKEEMCLRLVPDVAVKHVGDHEFNVVHKCPPDCPD